MNLKGRYENFPSGHDRHYQTVYLNLRNGHLGWMKWQQPLV